MKTHFPGDFTKSIPNGTRPPIMRRGLRSTGHFHLISITSSPTIVIFWDHVLRKLPRYRSFDFLGCGMSSGEYVTLGVKEKEQTHQVIYWVWLVRLGVRTWKILVEFSLKMLIGHISITFLPSGMIFCVLGRGAPKFARIYQKFIGFGKKNRDMAYLSSIFSQKSGKNWENSWKNRENFSKTGNLTQYAK